MARTSNVVFPASCQKDYRSKAWCFNEEGIHQRDGWKIMNVREWALPVYTILMQLAVGALLILWSIRTFIKSSLSSVEIDRVIRNPVLVISFTTAVAMLGAHFHLSKPFHSFLAIRNFQSSWLSREIVFTILFFLATSYLWFLTRYREDRQNLITYVGWVAILFGLVIVYCMASIYLIPTQVAWNSSTVIISFYIAMLLLGIVTIALLLVLDLKFSEIQKSEGVETRAQVIQYSIFWLTLLAFLAVLGNITISFYQIYLLDHGDIAAQTSLQLLFQLYMPLFITHLLFLGTSPLLLAYAVRRMRMNGFKPQELIFPIYMPCLLILIAEIIGRFLFYATHIRIGI